SRRLGDAAHELEELRGPHDRVRDRGRLDQVFLGHLRAEVAAREQAVGADDRQRQVMADARGGFRGQEVATRCLEERVAPWVDWTLAERNPRIEEMPDPVPAPPRAMTLGKKLLSAVATSRLRLRCGPEVARAGAGRCLLRFGRSIGHRPRALEA